MPIIDKWNIKSIINNSIVILLSFVIVIVQYANGIKSKSLLFFIFYLLAYGWDIINMISDFILTPFFSLNFFL